MFSRALCFFLAIGGISAQCLTGNDSPTQMNPATEVSLIDARFKFALDSLKNAAQIESKDNIFFSPYSLHQAISLAYFGARGETEANLKRALRLPDDLSKVDVQHYYAYENYLNEMRNSQNASGSYEYRVANKLWITDDRKLRECMLDFFGDQLEKTNFRSNPGQVRERINEWVSNATKGHIRDLLAPDAIQEDTNLVLANAVYFKGLWASRFDSSNSKRDIFYSFGSQNWITFMHQKGTFNYLGSEDLGVHILELPYKGHDISMFVLLPPLSTVVPSHQAPRNEPQNSVQQLVERLSTQRGLKELRELLDDGMPQREVEVSLPRFEIERNLPVGLLLNSMGAGDVMSQAADLRGFVDDGEQGLQLGDAVHRARIEVTEEGTTAAAATALFTFRSSRPIEPVDFKANHPFVYLIYDKISHTILFTGVYRTPPGAQPAIL